MTLFVKVFRRSSHTTVRFNWHSRDKLEATFVSVGTCRRLVR